MIPDLEIRPIDVWPDGWRTPRTRKPNPFRTAYDETLHALAVELDHLRSRSAHLQVDIDPSEIRRDGMLRARAQARHPGVILTIDSKTLGTLTYPCDTFTGRWASDPPDWQINLRAITLGLEALRKVERYGIAERGQQYAGYKALPPAATALGSAMTVDEAARLLTMAAGTPRGVSTIEEVAASANALWRDAAKKFHPDVGGDPETFRRLTEARDLLLAQR